MPTRLVLVLLTLAAATGVTRVAAAGDTALVVRGEPRLRKAVADDAAMLLAAMGWPVKEGAVASKDGDVIAACIQDQLGDEPCVAAVTSRIRAERLVFIMIVDEAGAKPTAQATTTVLTGWLLSRTGRYLATERRYCERCRDETLRTATQELVTELTRLASVQAATTTLRIRSTPEGARVLVDDEPVGVTPAEVVTFPGSHTVALEKVGHEPATRRVIVTEGAAVDVDVTLTPAAAAEPSVTEASSGPGVLPWIAIGAGASVAIAGGVLMALDETPVSDPEGERGRTYDNTFTAGLLTTGVGVAILGGGVAWLLLGGGSDRAAEGDAAEAAPPPIAVTAGPRGWSLTWQGRFR